MDEYRHLDRNGVCPGRYRAVRPVEEYMSPLHGFQMDMVWVSLGVTCWIVLQDGDDGPTFELGEITGGGVAGINGRIDTRFGRRLTLCLCVWHAQKGRGRKGQGRTGNSRLISEKELRGSNMVYWQFVNAKVIRLIRKYIVVKDGQSKGNREKPMVVV